MAGLTRGVSSTYSSSTTSTSAAGASSAGASATGSAAGASSAGAASSAGGGLLGLRLLGGRSLWSCLLGLLLVVARGVVGHQDWFSIGCGFCAACGWSGPA